MSKKGKVKHGLIFLLIVYLIVSSIYIIAFIDFEEPNGLYADSMPTFPTNEIRLFMGIPTTGNSYFGVSPLFLIEVIIKLAIAVVLIIYEVKAFKKLKA